MFKKFTNGCVKLMQKYLPDPFIFAAILTFLVFILGVFLTGQGPVAMMKHWGNGVWSLLSFSMQMVLVLVLGHALANAPAFKRILINLASKPKSAGSAIILVSVVSTIACWLNWGFGLVIGAILAKEIAKVRKDVDYRLLIASAYSGFLIWHAGLSGSIPLTIASGGPEVVKATGGIIKDIIPTTQTIFSPINLGICLVLLITLPLVNRAMMPSKDSTVAIDPSLLQEDLNAATIEVRNETPADKLENSKIITLLIGVLVLGYIIYYFSTSGFNLTLNIVNTIFLFFGVILHGTPRKYVKAINDAAHSSAGIILQFPFYGGIMGMMTGASAAGLSLAGVMSNGFVAISNNVTFPLFTFLSAGLVNFFVPSGGGQWAVQAPIMMPAGQALGVNPAVTAMAIAWGDAWTNMVQPFWALPALGIAGLGAKDIMGFCLVDLLYSGIIICSGFVIAGLI